MRRTRHTKESGITIVELLVVIVLLSIIMPIFALLLVSSYRESFVSNATTQLADQNTRALAYIEQSVRVSTDYMVGVPSPYSDAYGPHNSGTSGSEAWSYKGDGSTSRVLLLQGNATTTNSLSTGRLPVYRADGTFNCTTQKNYQPQLTYMTIYFVRNSTLYRRIITDTTSPLCSGDAQMQKQSCPPEIPSGSRDATCQASDEVIATNVSSFSIDYYQNNSPSSIIAAYSSSDPTILEPADYILVTLTLSTRSNTVVSTLTQRMAKGND